MADTYFRLAGTDRLRSDGELALLPKQAGAAHLAADDFFGVSGGPATVDGAAALTGSSSLIATGVVIKQGAAAMPATSGLAATGVVIKDGVGALAATSSFAAAAVVIKDGAGTLAATGSLVAAAVVIKEGSAGPSAFSDLSASGIVIKQGAAALSGLSALNGAGIVVINSAAMLDGVSGLAASGLVVVDATILMMAAATLSASGLVIGAAPAPALPVGGGGGGDRRVRRVYPPAIRKVVSARAALQAGSTLRASGVAVRPRIAQPGPRRAGTPVLPLFRAPPAAPPATPPVPVHGGQAVAASRLTFTAAGTVVRHAACALSGAGAFRAAARLIPLRRRSNEALILMVFAQMEDD